MTEAAAALAVEITTTIQMTPNSGNNGKKKLVTRRSLNVFGLGCKVTNDDAKITESRLPTSIQVLRCFMYHLDEGACMNRTRWQSAKLVSSMLTFFYKKENLPMISESKACEKIIKLLDDNSKIRAIPLKRRSTPNCIKKVQSRSWVFQLMNQEQIAKLVI